MSTDGIDLYWLPLGAGGHSVRWNGRVYEWIAARREGRARCDLYHSALQVTLDQTCFVVEQAPVPSGDGSARGVVAQGPVGARWAGRWRLFRYELRCWPGGRIPDVGEAVDSPRRVSCDPAAARALLEFAPRVPILVWGRDEAGTGQMWNSNSIVAWLLCRSGVDASRITPPPGGRAPGWAAGVQVARRP